MMKQYMITVPYISGAQLSKSTPYIAVIFAAVLLTTAIVVPLTILISACTYTAA